MNQRRYLIEIILSGGDAKDVKIVGYSNSDDIPQTYSSMVQSLLKLRGSLPLQIGPEWRISSSITLDSISGSSSPETIG